MRKLPFTVKCNKCGSTNCEIRAVGGMSFSPELEIECLDCGQMIDEISIYPVKKSKEEF